MSKLQDEFNRSTGDFRLPPGEYEGPLVVDRPCTVDGGGATLWADRGPVLIVTSAGVTLQNLRVEVAGPAAEGEAGASVRSSAPDTAFSQVEVSGRVLGVADEPEDWNVPRVIELGEFAAEKENSFAIELDMPAAAALACNISGAEVQPKRLVPGRNRVILKTEAMRGNTILYGELLITTKVTRRVYLSGRAVKGARERRELPLPTPPETAYVTLPAQVAPPAEASAPAAPAAAVETIRRGQRLSARGVEDTVVRIAYEHQGTTRQLEIDAYVFLLGENGKVLGDDGLVFFGHPESPNGAVRVSAGGDFPVTLVELGRTPEQVRRIAVCYSIYGDDPAQNFTRVLAPRIRVFGGDAELYRFELSELQMEKTVVAMELYRYNGEWRMSFVGAGYRSGLKALCGSYGVEVE